MSKRHLINNIEQDSQKDIRIGDKLAEIVIFCCQNNAVPGGIAIKTKDLVRACPEASYYRLERLVELGYLNKFKKGADKWIIHTTTGDYLDRAQFRARLHEEVRKLVQHTNTNPQIKQIVADVLNVSLSQVGTELTTGTVWEQRKKLEDAVDAIDAEPHVSRGNYGKIIIRNAPNYYHATGRAEHLYKK